MEQLDIKIIKFCAEEVERQHRGPIQTYWMVEAWHDAFHDREESAKVDARAALTLDLIEKWGRRIERERNTNGWRQIPASVHRRLSPMPVDILPRLLRWEDNLVAMTPEEAYYEFEVIHPFTDGNGRTGKIVYNWLSNTLENPKLPPNFFGGEAP